MEHSADAAGGASWLREPFLALLPLVLSAVAFFPITGNYFFADDFCHFYSIRNGSLFDYLTAPQGGHLLITSNTAFYLLSLLFGTNPVPYFWVVLATHLTNVYLLWLVIRTVTRSARLGCLGATLWGTSPTSEGSLGWLSVYGHVLVATAVLLLLYQLARVANGARPTWGTVVSWILLLFAASTSFGVGIGIAMAFPVAALALVPPSRTRARLVLMSCLVAGALPFLYVGLYRLHPSPSAGGSTLLEVLAPVAGYWRQALTFLFHLVVSGVSSLIAGAAFEWDRYPTALAYAVAALFFAAWMSALVSADISVRRWMAVCMVLALAAYAFIAMGRGRNLLAGSIVPLRALRYHYVVPAFFAITVCLMLSAFDRARRSQLSSAAKNVLLAATIACIAGVHVAYAQAIDPHERARRQTAEALAGIRQQIDATPAGEAAYIPNGVFGGVGPVLRRVPEIFPGWAGVFVVFFPDNVVDGTRVFFIDDRPLVRRTARSGRRTADLFVTSDSLPSGHPPTGQQQ